MKLGQIAGAEAVQTISEVHRSSRLLLLDNIILIRIINFRTLSIPEPDGSFRDRLAKSIDPLFNDPDAGTVLSQVDRGMAAAAEMVRIMAA